MPSVAGTPHVRTSRDLGRTYPARYAGPLTAEPPQQPCTVPVYDPGHAAGRLLALDLDPGRGRIGADPLAVVERQAAELGQLIERHVADVAPSGGRHVLVLFAAALPWLELRDLARAIALRFPAVDPAPHASLGGQISPPGARHKSGGWRLLTTPFEDARAAVEQPCGPEEGRMDEAEGVLGDWPIAKDKLAAYGDVLLAVFDNIVVAMDWPLLSSGMSSSPAGMSSSPAGNPDGSIGGG
jgi:hypothetical protein